MKWGHVFFPFTYSERVQWSFSNSDMSKRNASNAAEMLDGVSARTRVCAPI